MQDLLGTTLMLLAACSLSAVVTARLKVPALLGYIVVGAVLGPSVAAWIVPGEALSFLSELGVALLLFLVGLEFSLSHFWLIRNTVLVAGMLQMAVIATPLALILMALGLEPNAAALLGAAAAMSSMALAPVFIRHHDWLAIRLSRWGSAAPLPQAEEGDVATQAQVLSDHVIVCGAGDLGLVLCQTLKLAGVSHLLLESDAEQAATARAAGAPVVYGDAGRADTLHATGLAQARLIVVTFPHPQSVFRIARAVRQRHAALPVVVVCWRESKALVLKELPNVHVYKAAVALALGLAKQVMQLGGVSVTAANGALSSMRNATTL